MTTLLDRSITIMNRIRRVDSPLGVFYKRQENNNLMFRTAAVGKSELFSRAITEPGFTLMGVYNKDCPEVWLVEDMEYCSERG